MAFHRCTIQREDGTVLVTGAQVNIEEGAESWSGTIAVTHLDEVIAGGRYRIVLDDGRCGEFVVRRNTYAGGEIRAVACHGEGALRPQ